MQHSIGPLKRMVSGWRLSSGLREVRPPSANSLLTKHVLVLRASCGVTRYSRRAARIPIGEETQEQPCESGPGAEDWG
jgi:hypothetical protein